MWHCPISGSQINRPAKLYKKFTPVTKTESNVTAIIPELGHNIADEYIIRSIEVGDDLSGVRLYVEQENIPDEFGGLIVKSGNYEIVADWGIEVVHKIYVFDYSASQITYILDDENLETFTYYTLPLDFGVVTIVNDANNILTALMPNPNYEPTYENKFIKYENNLYRTYYSFAWVDATDKQLGEEQPISGLMAHTDYMTIKFNGTYKPKLKDVKEPEQGDLVMIDKELWIIEDGIQRVRNKSMVNFATVYLPLRKLL